MIQNKTEEKAMGQIFPKCHFNSGLNAQDLAQVTDHLLKGLAGLEVEKDPLRQAGLLVVHNLDDFPFCVAATRLGTTKSVTKLLTHLYT